MPFKYLKILLIAFPCTFWDLIEIYLQIQQQTQYQTLCKLSHTLSNLLYLNIEFSTFVVFFSILGHIVMFNDSPLAIGVFIGLQLTILNR